MIVVFTFVLTLFANMKSIQHAPVDTFICLRSTSPVGSRGEFKSVGSREAPPLHLTTLQNLKCTSQSNAEGPVCPRPSKCIYVTKLHLDVVMLRGLTRSSS